MATRITLPLETVDAENPRAWITDPHRPIAPEELNPELEVIVTASTGLNHLPVNECELRGIKVLSLLDDRKALNEIRASSEATFMLMLMTLRNTQKAMRDVRNWQENEDIWRGNELYGKKVGIIGLGRIGSNMFRWLKAFDAEVAHIYDPRKIHKTSLEDLFTECDIIIVSCSLNEETEGMIGYDLLRRLKRGAVLVNTARGEVLVEDDLVRILLERPDLRVGIDVVAGETQGTHLSSPLFQFNNVTILPHMAGITVESQTKAAEIACKLLREAHGMH